jgi:hypothetical protein
VKRTDATSGGTPITHTIAVQVVTDEGGIPKNTLHELVAKGQSIPANGIESGGLSRSTQHFSLKEKWSVH